MKKELTKADKGVWGFTENEAENENIAKPHQLSLNVVHL